MTIREQIVEEARSWLGTPYHHMGKVKKVGVDCGQFLIAVFENVGILKPGEISPGYYSHDFHFHRDREWYLEYILSRCKLVEQPLPGDIAMFHFARLASHGAIVLENNIVIHSYVDMGVVLSRIDEAILLYKNGKSRLRGYWRPKGVD